MFRPGSALVLFALLLAACTTMNQAMTPSLKVMKDSFDGATIVRQEPVSASASLAEGWHTLGFEWKDKTPDLVFITAGVNGITNITAVAFNADGKVIDKIEPASAITEYGDWSSRRFVMPWSAFLEVAGAQSVKMRVSRINDYTVSTFGPAHHQAIVNGKIPPFVEKVREQRR